MFSHELALGPIHTVAFHLRHTRVHSDFLKPGLGQEVPFRFAKTRTGPRELTFSKIELTFGKSKLTFWVPRRYVLDVWERRAPFPWRCESPHSVDLFEMDLFEVDLFERVHACRVPCQSLGSTCQKSIRCTRQ